MPLIEHNPEPGLCVSGPVVCQVISKNGLSTVGYSGKNVEDCSSRFWLPCLFLVYTQQLQEVLPYNRYPLLAIITMGLQTYILFSPQDSEVRPISHYNKEEEKHFFFEAALRVS